MIDVWFLNNWIIEGSVKFYICSPCTHLMPKERDASIYNCNSGSVLYYTSMKGISKIQRETFLALPELVNREPALGPLLRKIKGFEKTLCSLNDREDYMSKGRQISPSLYSPSATSSSTVNLRLFPLRTTRTVCHSLSLSFCPAYRVSGPLPKDGGKCQS